MSAPELPVVEPSTPGVPALEALEGLPVDPGTRLEGARLSPTTATTLRAALDLLLGESAPRRPLEARWDDGALEVRCPLLEPEAVTLAAGLLETIEGSLGPPAPGRREWVLRAPLLRAEGVYLMLRQGTLALAVPWHSVLRVRMVRTEDLAELARREGSAVLPPLVSVPAKPEPRPAVLLGLGLKRAYLQADRLIWRLPAQRSEEPAAESLAGSGRSVRTADGEVYWAMEAAELLAEVEPMPLPKGGPPAEAEDPPPPPAPRDPPAPRSRREQGPFRILRPGEVEPLGAPAPSRESPPAAPPKAPASPPPVAAPTPGPAAPRPSPAPAPPVAAPAPAPPRPAETKRPRALVAEDSLIGRIFLERLLERRGFEVTGVGTARELQAELARGPWDVVMADVELPDAGHAEHLRRLAVPGAWVALVRDREDERRAEEAGVKLHLRKPFESEHLDELLPRLRRRSSAS